MAFFQRLILSLFVVGVSLPSSAHAAIRRCAAPIDQTGTAAATEREAKRLAMEAWIAQAALIGKEFTAWRLALAKDLSCSNPPAGGFVCRATGQPCRVNQVPGPEPISPQPIRPLPNR